MDPVQAPTVSAPQPTTPSPAPSADYDYPVSVAINLPDQQSRLLALFGIPFFLIRYLLLIPQLIVVYVLTLASFMAAWLNLWAILFTGHKSAGLSNFVVGTLRWNTRVSTYLFGLTDKYPPFRLGQ